MFSVVRFITVTFAGNNLSQARHESCNCFIHIGRPSPLSVVLPTRLLRCVGDVSNVCSTVVDVISSYSSLTRTDDILRSLLNVSRVRVVSRTISALFGKPSHDGC